MYGADVHITGNPIGGGEGYEGGLKRSQAKYVVDTYKTLVSAFSRAIAGESVYVEDGASIEVPDQNVKIPKGLIWGAGRGVVSRPGRITRLNIVGKGSYNYLFVGGQGAVITGLAFQGPDQEVGSSSNYAPLWGCFLLDDGAQVLNCEGFGWPEEFILVNQNGMTIRHNSVHHNRRTGFGYGVLDAWGNAVIEANIFNQGRHFIAAERGFGANKKASSYVARFNIFGAECTNTCVDCHGGNDNASMGFPKGPDSTVPAGGTLVFANNTFLSKDQPSVGIRGVPLSSCVVERNLSLYPGNPYVQRLENLHLTPYVNMVVVDNKGT
jgi:hypothetical protein